MEACNGNASSPVRAKEEAARWVALEKLPTLERLRTSILMKSMAEGETGEKSCRQLVGKEVHVRKLTENDIEDIIRRNFKVADDDNETFLERLRDCFDRLLLYTDWGGIAQFCLDDQFFLSILQACLFMD